MSWEAVNIHKHYCAFSPKPGEKQSDCDKKLLEFSQAFQCIHWIRTMFYTVCIGTGFCKEASWTWCTDSGVPPQDGRATGSPMQREVGCLNSNGLSAKNALPKPAQSFRSCLWQEHLPSAFTRPAKRLAAELTRTLLFTGHCGPCVHGQPLESKSATPLLVMQRDRDM